MSSNTAVEQSKHNLLLLWDAHYAPHHKFNEALIKSLRADKPLNIIYCSGYINDKHSCLETTHFDWLRMQTLSSRREVLARKIKKSIKQIVRKECKLEPSFLTLPSIKATPAESLCSLEFRKDLQRKIFNLRSQELFRLSHRGYPVCEHFCVDMSLDCKSTSKDLKPNTPELHILRLTAYYSALMVEALHEFFQTVPKADYLCLSTSVYSLDWVCRGFALTRGHEHLFVMNVSDGVPRCQVNSSYSHDLVLRRQLQEDEIYYQDFLINAIDYALGYLVTRLSARSAHTYSPLTTQLSELERVGELINANPKSNLWVYYTNSPDELISISHDHQHSGAAEFLPWDSSGVVQNEIEALHTISHMAHQHNAMLVIRQHPRLGPEARSSFLSSEYHVLADCCRRLEKMYPKRVLTFEPWSSINSYELALHSDRVVSFRGTMPLEVSLLGIRPLVLAVNKGYMNFAIKLHSERAPRTFEELRKDLTSNPTYYSFQELEAFLVQFYLARRHGVLTLSSDISSISDLSLALNESSSISQAGPQAPSCAKDSPPNYYINQALIQSTSIDANILISSYLEKAYSIAAGAFGLSVRKNQRFHDSLREMA